MPGGWGMAEVKSLSGLEWTPHKTSEQNSVRSQAIEDRVWEGGVSITEFKIWCLTTTYEHSSLLKKKNYCSLLGSLDSVCLAVKKGLLTVTTKPGNWSVPSNVIPTLGAPYFAGIVNHMSNAVSYIVTLGHGRLPRGRSSLVGGNHPRWSRNPCQQLLLRGLVLVKEPKEASEFSSGLAELANPDPTRYEKPIHMWYRSTVNTQQTRDYTLLLEVLEAQVRSLGAVNICGYSLICMCTTQSLDPAPGNNTSQQREI